MRKKDVVCVLLVLMGAVIFVISALKIETYMYESAVSDNGNRTAANMHYKKSTTSYIDRTENTILPEDEMDIEAMKLVNPDTVGFLKVQDKELPVVQSDKNEKYMKTGWDGKKTSCGTVFMDSYCDVNGKNLVLYGHHMKSGKMFGSLDKYLSKAYRDENPTFKWITDEYVDTYTVVAVVKGKASDIEQLLDMDLKSDVDSLSEKAKSTNTLYDALHTGKSYMSLVTCEYTMKNGRLVVIGERTGHVERK